jgi:hypothetical protein
MRKDRSFLSCGLGCCFLVQAGHVRSFLFCLQSLTKRKKENASRMFILCIKKSVMLVISSLAHANKKAKSKTSFRRINRRTKNITFHFLFPILAPSAIQ